MCSLAMNPSSGPGSQFFQSTTAGCSPAFSEPLSPYDFSASTVALAQPFGWHERVERHYSQTSKSLAFLKYGLRLWHGKAYHVEVSL
jgi:hypothetical protein